MTVKVISNTESVIYKKKIYRNGETLIVSARVGNSLIERGYVEKISDEPAFSDDTTDENEFDRLLLNDAKDGKQYQVYIKDTQVYVEEKEA
jgi:hypothetical protein